MHAVAAQLQTQRIVQALHRKLAGPVNGVGGDTTQSRQAAQGDQGTPAAFDVRQRMVSHVERAKEIDTDNLFHRTQVGTLEVGPHGKTGRTDENIERAEAVDRRLDGPAALVGIGHVGRDRQRLAAASGGFGSNFLKHIRTAGSDGNAHAQPRQTQGGRSSDSGGAARDESDLADQRAH